MNRFTCTIRTRKIQYKNEIERLIKQQFIPSTNDVNNVTFAALRRPAGKFKPIFSSFSRNKRPPFLLLALQIIIKNENHLNFLINLILSDTYRRSTPPKSDAFRHSGGDNLLCTSAIVTLYFDVLDNRLRRPGTEQNTSLGDPTLKLFGSLPPFIAIGKKS